MLRSFSVGAVLAVCGVLPVVGQSSLETYFTGKEVVVKIDMPGSQAGIDLSFNKTSPMDWGEYSQRIKTYGVAIHKGDTVRVTRLVEKGDRIEFQLAGGGFGTAGDDSNTFVPAAFVPKSDYEKSLEKQVANATDPRQKRDLQNDLDRERNRRERQNAQNQEAARIASQMKAQLVAGKRLQGGSRFNLRWQGSIPGDYRNPEAVMRLLSEYVDFGSAMPANVGPPRVPMAQPAPMYNAPAGNSPVNGGPAPGSPQVKRGMKMGEVSSLLGPGRQISDSVSNDGLRMQVMEYHTHDSVVSVTYVEGVVVRYSINSN